MPRFHITAQAKQIHQVVWDGEAPSRQAAEQQMMRLHSQAVSGEDVSGSGLQLYGTYAQLGNVKSREVEPRPPKAPVRPHPRQSPTSTVEALYLLHTAWDAAWEAIPAEEQRRFLFERLTQNQRRFLAHGFSDEDEEDM